MTHQINDIYKEPRDMTTMLNELKPVQAIELYDYVSAIGNPRLIKEPLSKNLEQKVKNVGGLEVVMRYMPQILSKAQEAQEAQKALKGGRRNRRGRTRRGRTHKGKTQRRKH